MIPIKLYLDMDGVITDFGRAVTELGPEPALGLSDDASDQAKQIMYDAVEGAGEAFWSRMQWAPDGQRLWNLLRPYRPVILSSPGLFSHAVTGKIQWLKNNLPEATYFFEDHKSQYAERDAVLIDDTKRNIDAWGIAGGTGILYSTPEEVMQKLELIINPGLRKKPMISLASILRNALSRLEKQQEKQQKLEEEKVRQRAQMQERMKKRQGPAPTEPGVPREWVQERERIQERTPEEPDALIKQRIEHLKSQVKSRIIERPSLFRRDLQRIVHDIKSPEQFPVKEELMKFDNDVVGPAMTRKEPFMLPAEFQNQVLDGMVKFDPTQLQKVHELFLETYKLRSAFDIIRRLASYFSMVNRQTDIANS